MTTCSYWKKTRAHPSLETRIRHARDESPPAAGSSLRKAVIESSDDDLDDTIPNIRDIHNIWDDDRNAARDDDDDLDDMDNFIEYEEDEEAGATKQNAKNDAGRGGGLRKSDAELWDLGQSWLVLMQSMYTFPFVHCISCTPSSAWDEIYEVFGDGHDYDWALNKHMTKSC